MSNPLSHAELERVLAARRSQKLVYVPNPGNAGDAFIAHATYQLFHRLNLNVEIGYIGRIYPNRIVLCGGGGNIVAHYRDMSDFIARNHLAVRELILLPHTVRGHEDLLGQLGENAHLFCREVPSFEFVRHAAPQAKVHLSHDLAFYCNLEETRRHLMMARVKAFPRQVRRPREATRRWWRLQARMHRGFARRAPTGILNAFRTDIERTGVRLPADNFDVSVAFAGGPLTQWDSQLTTHRMIRFLTQYRVIRTNRLHVAILSAMLGLEVDFHDNNYGKNRAVYVHSMRGHFPNVQWHDGHSSSEMCYLDKCETAARS